MAGVLEKDLLIIDVDPGMESSRGGPLTTFIMMLPLIIVPAIAMLKPVDQKGSLLSSLLSAAPSEDEAEDQVGQLPDADGFSSDVFGMGDLGAPSGSGSEFEAPDDFSDLESALFAEASDGISGAKLPASPRVNAVSGRSGGASLLAGNSGRAGNDADTQHLLAVLRQLGVTRTLWFTPGSSQSVGFVAFFQPGQGIISYRFEAIAGSRAAAATAVVMQVKEWLANQRL